MKERKKGTINKALAVLDCFSDDCPRLTVSEIASKLDIPFATAHRTIVKLLGGNFLDRDQETKKLSLGPKLYYLGRLARSSNSLMAVCRPFMEKLRDRTEETVNLYVMEGNCRICYEQTESFQPLKHASPLGKKLPLWAGASGKCFLAFIEGKDDDLIADMVDQIHPLTPSTIPNEEALLDELEKIRSRGYAISEAEREEGVSSVAAPIFDGNGDIVASLAVSGPSIRFDSQRKDLFAKALLETVREISVKLGYS
ncbi:MULTISPECIES: IclR family transcriptional regulator [Dethiosulfovibrio]|uniref:IclR family transcriptional regulator n=2 Tax=Dethiosulfovibrio TaxID=47054 RepID=A0ABS9EP47_9BACT|nr:MULTISPECIES: IclR family transcriptional regulator [Dethiosulfovibrio]MCF4113222.1 IclR family transcriptional regulator [Dethiosulfovibrio russensis]MCF4142286.1 IclR family transcriptional regulator [Dethiosulfovibrio marinus]MCF4144594.1 IclR family transcriptional regulator [Dethiosulfovibrio acidaminovorans]